MLVIRLRWLATLGWTLSLTAALQAQQPVVWRNAATKPTASETTATTALSPTTASPVAILGRPLPLASPQPRTVRATGPVVRAQAPESVPPPEEFHRPPPPPTANPELRNMTPTISGEPEQAITIPLDLDVMPRIRDPHVGTAPPAPIPASHTVQAPPDNVPPPPESPFPPPSDIIPGASTDHSVAPTFWDRCIDAISWGDKGNTHGRSPFGSDNCFPGLISPITMPFYFEDPRSLSEIRPLFSYQSIPGNNPYTDGGSAMFFGTQLRLSITDRLSFVLNELGFLNISPDVSTPPFSSSTGFAELKMGPKWTFLRNTETGTVAAVGLTFEIPCGSASVFQNTGSLSLDPYLSLAQIVNLGSGWGSLNFMGTTGYSFSVDNQRAEFYYLNFHVDYNIAGLNTIYPLFELSWIHYGNTPNSQPFNFEGAYLINFGSSERTTSDYLSLAGGLRYRFAENIYAGLAVDFPVLKEKGFADYRVLFDVIFRF